MPEGFKTIDIAKNMKKKGEKCNLTFDSERKKREKQKKLNFSLVCSEK